MTTVASLGHIQISSLLVLKNVLNVPKLSTNLVSIQKLTQDLYCIVIFHPTHYVFQDQDLGTMIGHAKEHDGLYYLETSNNQSIIKDKSSLLFLSNCYSSNKEKILLHHRRLGHPSFRTIQNLFPSLFQNLDEKHFHCDVCELAKQKCRKFSNQQ